MADATTTTAARRAHPAHSALVGLASLGVLLQGVWAGLFLGGSDDYGTWASVHQHGGEATVLLASLATVAALVWLRGNRPVLVGTTLLFVLLVVELLLGMAIDGTRTAVVVHIPLAMLLLGLAVWLPTAARRA
ncbi:hypothetical protein SAMN05660485_03075 [Blastococcus fimeti]|nr:hypothetical protein SAMN05660485_03075 [Blastococcus fimeti]